MERFLKRAILFSVLTLTVLACEKHEAPELKQTDFVSAPESVDEESEPFFKGFRDFTRFKSIELPAEVRRRQEAESKQKESENAEFRCDADPALQPFQIQNPKLVINVDTQKMDLDFQVETKKGTEKLNLRGSFDRNQSSWRSELYSTDQKVLESRRVQAVALCVTAHVCDVIAVNIYYVFENKGYCRQLQTRVKEASIATSGDEAEEEEESEETSEDETGNEPSDSQPRSDLLDPQSWFEAIKGATPRPQAEDVESPKAKKPVLVKAPPKLEEFTPEQRQNAAIDYTGVMKINTPKEDPYRLERLPAPPTQERSSVLAQAIGMHDRGKLQRATYLPLFGPGFVRQVFLQNPAASQETDSSSAWGTERTREFLMNLGHQIKDEYKIEDQFVVTSISRKFGGQRPKVAKGSHQTGLDIDILYLEKDEVSGRDANLFAGVSRGRLTPKFDIAKNWILAKSVMRAGRDWTIVMFMDQKVKQAFCKHAKESGEQLHDPKSLSYQTLRSIRHWEGHHNHLHIRLYCPGNEGCGNKMVSLPAGTGCP